MKNVDELQTEYENEMRAPSENELNVTIYLTCTHCMCARACVYAHALPLTYSLMVFSADFDEFTRSTNTHLRRSNPTSIYLPIYRVDLLHSVDKITCHRFCL